MRGQFITFEGGEGAGKSTHAAGLAERLRALGIDVELTREPGGSPGAEIIRHVLLSGIAKPLGADAEAILFAAARDDHVRNRIAPALQRGTWVICDRFTDSTRVYQGMLGQVDGKLLNALERVTIGTLKPDLTIILDTPAELGLRRAQERRGHGAADRFEGESLEAHAAMREAFLRIAAENPERCVPIDASRSKTEVAEAIWAAVQARLAPARAPALVEAGA